MQNRSSRLGGNRLNRNVGTITYHYPVFGQLGKMYTSRDKLRKSSQNNKTVQPPCETITTQIYYYQFQPSFAINIVRHGFA